MEQQEQQPAKRKGGRPKGSKTKAIPKPARLELDGKRVIVPHLPERDATTTQIVEYLHQQDKVIGLLHLSLQKYREMFRTVKIRKEISPNVVTSLAAVGHSMAQIQRAMGFGKDIWHQREDIRAAYEEGRSALESALLSKQVEMALDGNEKLIVWLGKVMLGQVDSPTVAVQVNNNGVGASVVSIKEKMAEARKKAVTQFNETVEVINADIVDTGKDE
jgi:hypothetical protein